MARGVNRVRIFIPHGDSVLIDKINARLPSHWSGRREVNLDHPFFQLSYHASACPLATTTPSGPIKTRSKMKATLLTAAFLAQALASPLVARQEDGPSDGAFSHEGGYSAQVPSTPAFPIHDSCNATLSAQLTRALDETVVLARHAKEHLLRWGGESPFVQKYFGNGTTSTPIGWYERVVAAERGGIVFRCDDPDGNCATQDGTYRHQLISPLLPLDFP